MVKTKAYVTLYQRQIVLNSAVIEKEEYKNLKETLTEHSKITQSILDNDKCAEQRTKDIIENASNEIYNIARDEWVAVKCNDVGNIKCSLCNEPNKLIYFIKNKINGKTLNVGSSCIQHFTNLNYESTGESIEKLNRQIMKSHEIVNCKIDFNKMYPDVDKKTFEYRKTLEMSPLILPQDIYCLFGNKIKTIDDFKTRYLLGKIKKSLLPTLQTTIHECDSYFTSVIPLWMEQHQESKYLCTLEMKIWLTEHHLEETVAKIREQGSMITADTISNIAYQPFIKSMLLEFRSKLRPLFNTIELYDGKIYVTINNRRLRDIVFWCSPGRFMTTFGQALLLPNFSLPGIKSCLRFQLLLGDQISDIHNLLNKLNKLFSSEYQFLYSHDTEQVYIISFERRKFVYLNGIKSITQYLVPNVLDSNYQCNAELNYFKKIWSWIPMVKFDVNQLNELRKSNDI